MRKREARDWIREHWAAAIEGMEVPADLPDAIDNETYRAECDKIAERIRRTIQFR